MASVQDWQAFWTNRQAWPRDYIGSNVFLAVAVDEIGKAMFPEWTGDEPATTHDLYRLWTIFTTDGQGNPLAKPVGIPVPESAATRVLVCGLLASRTPPIRVEIETSHYGMKTYKFPPGAWKVGCEMAHEIDTKRLAARSRFSSVQHKIRDGIASGALVSVLRPLAGGEFGPPVKPADWSTEQIYGRFLSCKMPNDPFGCSPGPRDARFIFVTRNSLDRFKEALASPIASAAPPKQNTTAGRSGFKDRLNKLMLASPDQRTIAKDKQIAIGTKEFKLSVRDASGVRDKVLMEVPENVRKAWSKPGPTAPLLNS